MCVSESACLCVCVCVSLCESVCPWVCVWCYVCVCVSLWACVYVRVCVLCFMYVIVIVIVCVCVCVRTRMNMSLPAERRSLWRLHYVPWLRPASAERPEEDGGCTSEAQRGAQRRKTQGQIHSRSTAASVWEITTQYLRLFLSCSPNPSMCRSSHTTCSATPCGSEAPCWRPPWVSHIHTHTHTEMRAHKHT